MLLWQRYRKINGRPGRVFLWQSIGRFISYMYLYENGRKTINSGFVRVESRNGQCRLSIHMSGIYHSEAKKVSDLYADQSVR